MPLRTARTCASPSLPGGEKKAARPKNTPRARHGTPVISEIRLRPLLTNVRTRRTNIQSAPATAINGAAMTHSPNRWSGSCSGRNDASSPTNHRMKLIGNMANAIANWIHDHERRLSGEAASVIFDNTRAGGSRNSTIKPIALYLEHKMRGRAFGFRFAEEVPILRTWLKSFVLAKSCFA